MKKTRLSASFPRALVSSVAILVVAYLVNSYANYDAPADLKSDETTQPFVESSTAVTGVAPPEIEGDVSNGSPSN